ncbi:MAG: hypothetical protein ACLP01_13575 [Solirubrobacteraceae bacterium]
MRINKRWVAPLVVVGALAAGGAAYTNGIDTTGVSAQESTIGYGKVTVAGATVTDVQYGLSANGQTIETEQITFDSNHLLPAGQLVYAAWNDDSGADLGVAQMTQCTTGNISDASFGATTTAPFNVAQCSISTPVSGATDFDVTVSPPNDPPGGTAY